MLVQPYVTQILSRYKEPEDREIEVGTSGALFEVDAISEALTAAMQNLVEKLPDTTVNNLCDLSETELETRTNQLERPLFSFLAETRALFAHLASIPLAITGAETILCLNLAHFLSRNEVDPIALQTINATLEENKLKREIATPHNTLLFKHTEEKSDAETSASLPSSPWPPKRAKLS